MESDLFGSQAASGEDIEEVEEELTAAEVLQKLEKICFILLALELTTIFCTII